MVLVCESHIHGFVIKGHPAAHHADHRAGRTRRGDGHDDVLAGVWAQGAVRIAQAVTKVSKVLQGTADETAAVSFLQDDEWTNSFMWETGQNSNKDMIKDSQERVQVPPTKKLGRAWMEVGDSILMFMFRRYLVFAVIDFMHVEVCHMGKQTLKMYSLPDFSPEVESDLFETTYNNKAHTIKEKRLRREFPYKSVWLTAHNDEDANNVMAGNTGPDEDGAEDEGAVLLQVTTSVTTLDATKKKKVLPAMPERFGGFKDDPRYWTDKKTGLGRFCNSTLFKSSTLGLGFIFFLYLLLLIAQFGLATCAALFHLLSLDSGFGDSDNYRNIRDTCLS